MKITIGPHEHVETFPAKSIPAFARVTAQQFFTNEDDQTVGAQSPKSAEYVKQVAVTYSAGISQIAGFSGANQIDSTVVTATSRVLGTYTLALYTAKGKWITDVYSGLQVPELPTTTSWADIALYSSTYCEPFRHNYYDRDQINALLAGLSLAPLANFTVIGRTRLTRDPISLLDPEAVGSHDWVWEGIKETKYLGEPDYDDLATAIATIGATQTELRITEQVAVTVNTSIPANILISLEGNGSFTVSTTKTLTIGSMRPPALTQVFFGAGTVVLGAGAVPYANPVWWGTLAAAITSIGAVQTRLTVTSQISVAATLAIPANIAVSFDYTGSFTVATGQTLTINNLIPPPTDQQFFFGLGDVIVASGELWLEWWSGPGAAGDYTNAMDQARLSLLAQGAAADQGAGILNIGAGEFGISQIVIPNFSTIRGAGNDPDGVNGTVLKYAPASAPVSGDKYVFSAVEGYRMLSLENLTISTRGTNDAHQVFVERSDAGQSGFNFFFDRVCFQSALAPTVNGVVFQDGNGVGATEMIGAVFNSCWFQYGTSVSAAAPGAAFYVDSVNFNAHFQGVTTFQINVNSDAVQAYRRGWMLFDMLDPRGVTPSPFVYTTTLERTIASASLIAWPTDNYFGLITLDPATPQADQFKPDDMGQRFMFDVGGPNETTDYIFQIIDNFNAVYSRYLGPDVVSQPLEAHRWNDFAGRANAVFNLQGDNRTLIVNGGADEGFNYTLIASANLNFATIFNGYTGQGKVKFTGANEMFKSVGCRWYGGTFHDLTSGPQVQASFDETTQFDNHTVYGDVYVREGFVWGEQNWISLGLPATQTLKDHSSKQYWVDPPLGTTFSYSNYAVDGQNRGSLYSGWEDEDTANAPVRWSAQRVRKQLVGDTQIVQKRIGLQDYFGKWVYYYDEKYNDYNGRREFTGNQTGVKGYDFDSDIQAPIFIADALEVDWPFNLDFETLVTRPGTLRITDDGGSYNLGGLAINMGAGSLPWVDNQPLWIVNVGTGVRGLLNEWDNLGSPVATNRFATDTGETIYLAPGEAALALRDATLDRWRVFQFRNPNGLVGYPKFLTVTQNRNNTTTLSNTPLAITLPIGYYDLECVVNSMVPTRGLKLAFAQTGTMVGQGQWTCSKMVDPVTAAVAGYVSALTTSVNGIDFDSTWTFRGSVNVTAAGVLTLQAAQHTAHASDTTLILGSKLMAIKATGVV